MAGERPGQRDGITSSPWLRLLVVICSLVLLALLTLGSIFFARHERHDEISAWKARLSAMADDRQAAVEAWLHERWGDARVVASFPTVKALLASPSAGQGEEETHLGGILSSMKADYGYLGGYLLDRRGAPVMDIPGSPPLPGQCVDAARHMPANLSDKALLYRGKRSGATRIGFLVRVTAGLPGSPGEPVGWVLLVMDPSRWLFPLLKREPVPTPTGETLLAEAEDGSILFISPLRFNFSTPLTFQLPLSTPTIAARFALKGRSTFGEFTDYRGVPIYAATRTIKGTDWGLVVKVDRSEVLGGYHRIMALYGILLVAILGTVGAGGYGVLRNQRVRGLKAVLAEREGSRARIEQLNRLLKTISEVNQLIVREHDRDRLLAGACNILVDHGMFSMAWVGFKREASVEVKPEACSKGARTYLEEVIVRWDESSEGLGPTGTCIRENRHVVNPDSKNNPAMAPWRGAILRQGYRSSAAFPLRMRGAPNGALTVYMDAPDAFGEEEIALLDELADDLGHALEAIDDRAERQKAQEALRESEEKLRLFVEQTPVAVAMFDRDMRYLAVSRGWLADYKLGDRDIIGLSHYEVFPEIPERWKNVHRRGLSGEVLEADEDRFERADGSVQWVHWIVRPWHDAEGAVSGVVIFTEDITEQRESKEALRIAHQRLRRFVDSNIVGIVVADTRGGILEANDYYLDLIGYSRGELERGEVDWRTITPPEWLPADEKAIAELHQRGVCRPYEKEYVRRDGTRIPVLLADAVLPGPEEQLAVFVLDLTPQKQAEEALRLSEERFASFMNNLPARAFIKDADSRYLYLNSYMADSLGGPREELLGRSPEEMYGDETGAALRRHDAQALALEKPTIWGEELNVRGERRLYESVKFPIQTSSGVLLGGISTDVTERILMMEDLQASEERFRTLVENLGEGVGMVDADETVTYSNPAQDRIFGVDPGGLVGRNLSEFTTPEEFSRYGRETEIRRKGQRSTYETVITRPDGEVRHLLVTSTPRYGTDGTFAGTFSICADITERKRAEQEMRAKDELLRLTGEMAHVGGWEFDAETGEGQWTDEVARIHDLDPAVETSASFGLGFYADEAKGIIQTAVTNAVEKAEPYDLELPLVSAKGVRKWVRTQGMPILEDGRVVRVKGTFQDITGRKEAEERIHLLNDRLRSLARAIQKLAAARDLNAVIDVVRSSARALVGADGVTFVLRDGDQCHYVEEDAIGPLWKGKRFPLESCISGWAMLNAKPAVVGDIYADDRIPIDAYRPTFVQSLAMVPIRRDRPVGAIGAYWAAKRNPTGDEVAILQTLADATARAIENVKLYEELERRVKERTAELEEANKELESFSYSVSHDLRAPLRAIDGFSRAVLEDYGDKLDQEAARLLGVVRSSTLQMATLIDDLLTLSRAGRHEIRHALVDMEALAAKVFEELTGGAPGNNVDFRLEHLPDAFGDRSLLRQVWANLLGNALKFSAGRERPVIEVRGAREGDELLYRVKDNGVGFDPRYSDKLFVVFQRLHSAEAFEGTGVGLAIVKRIVSRHGGRVWGACPEEGGAEFSFILPARQEASDDED